MNSISYSDSFYTGNVNIVTGTIVSGTLCKAGGILQIDKDTGKFTAYDFSKPVTETGAGYIALEEIKAGATAVPILMSGTVITDRVCKSDGSTLSTQDIARLQAFGSHIIYY